MFLGKLFIPFFCVSLFFVQAKAQNGEAAPSIDIFGDEKPKSKPAAKPKAKPAASKAAVKPKAKPVARAVAKPVKKPVAKATAKKAKKDAAQVPPPSSPAFPTSRIAPMPTEPAPVAAPIPAPAPAVPTAKTKTEPVKRVVRAPFGEFEKRVSAGYSTWREPMTYAVGTLNQGAKASFAGFLFRYELSKRDRPVNWGGSVGFFYGGADAKSNDSSTYRVNKVGAQALIASPFAFFEPMPDVQVKIALDIVYKLISWPSTLGAYDVKTKPFGYGPNIGIEYRVWNQWSVEQKIGSYSPAGDIYWLVAATYQLP